MPHSAHGVCCECTAHRRYRVKVTAHEPDTSSKGLPQLSLTLSATKSTLPNRMPKTACRCRPPTDDSPLPPAATYCRYRVKVTAHEPDSSSKGLPYLHFQHPVSPVPHVNDGWLDSAHSGDVLKTLEEQAPARSYTAEEVGYFLLK